VLFECSATEDAIAPPPSLLSSETAHGRRLVRVAVRGKLYAGVPWEVLDVLRVCATREHDREAAVPLLIPL
jgi:hypothetical protein